MGESLEVDFWTFGMGESQEVQLQVMVQEAKEAKTPDESITANQSTEPKTSSHYWWLRISIYAAFLLFGQSAALIVQRLYFVKGGSSKWVETLVQIVGFPILIPYYFIAGIKNTSKNDQTKSPSILTCAFMYGSLGLIVATICFLYTIGLQYLPVSTYALICSSQLAFNCLFSYFLNSQKFTPFILNSLVLLTISSILLVFNNESEGPSGVSKLKYAIGFICTIAASAGYAFALSLTQFFFRKFLKGHSFRLVMDMIIYQEIVATLATLIGLFASGEWAGLTKEMNDFQMGKASYVMNLVGTAVVWQVYAIGCVGLIFEASSVFTNVIGMLGLPLVPILSMVFFHEKMDGIKAISMVLAVWGFASYAYQHYLDHHNSKPKNTNANEVSEG